MLVPSAVMPPSAMKRRLDEQHRRDAQHAGPRPDQHGGHRSPQEMAAGAGRDREVHHLAGEDEGGDEPRHGRGTVVEFAPRSPESESHATDGDHPGRDRGRGVEESVGNVHARHTTLLQLVCNKPRPDRSLHRERPAPDPPAASPPATPPPTSPCPPTPARTYPVRPARPQGDRVLLPRRDDLRLHQAGLRLHRVARLAARRRLRGHRHLPRQARQAGEVPRARQPDDHPGRPTRTGR